MYVSCVGQMQAGVPGLIPTLVDTHTYVLLCKQKKFQETRHMPGLKIDHGFSK